MGRSSSLVIAVLSLSLLAFVPRAEAQHSPNGRSNTGRQQRSRVRSDSSTWQRVADHTVNFSRSTRDFVLTSGRALTDMAVGKARRAADAFGIDRQSLASRSRTFTRAATDRLRSTWRAARDRVVAPGAATVLRREVRDRRRAELRMIDDMDVGDARALGPSERRVVRASPRSRTTGIRRQPVAAPSYEQPDAFTITSAANEPRVPWSTVRRARQEARRQREEARYVYTEASATTARDARAQARAARRNRSASRRGMHRPVVRNPAHHPRANPLGRL